MLLQRIVEQPFAVAEYPVLSADLKDLLQKIMVKNPLQRIDMAGIMRHPWFQTDLPEGAMQMNSRLQKQKSGIQVTPLRFFDSPKNYSVHDCSQKMTSGAL